MCIVCKEKQRTAILFKIYFRNKSLNLLLFVFSIVLNLYQILISFYSSAADFKLSGKPFGPEFFSVIVDNSDTVDTGSVILSY